MARRGNSFDGGTGNDTVLLTAGSTGNTGGNSGDYFDAVFNSTGTALVFSTTQAMSGFSMRCSPATPTRTGIRWDGTHTATNYGRFYIRPGSFPSSGINRILEVFAGVLNYLIVIDPAAKLRIVGSDGSAVWAQGTTVLTAGNWVRIEWQEVQSATVGQVVVRLYTDPESETITETLDSGATRNIAGTNELMFAIGTNEVWTAYYDDLVGGALSWVGPQSRVVPQTIPTSIRWR